MTEASKTVFSARFNLPHEKDAERFHEMNPRVYEILVRLARQAKAKGRDHCGIRMLWEVMRWEIFISTTDDASDFKLNDHYTSWYARFIMAREPDLIGFFRLRGAPETLDTRQLDLPGTRRQS